jgi:glycosyltransferase involved in cell wall biosynthesis
VLSYLAFPAKVLFVDHLSKARSLVSFRRPISRRVLDWFSTLRIFSMAGVSEFITNDNRLRFGERINQLTIYNGVNIERFSPRRSSPGISVRIVTTAHLIPEKGINVLIEAFAKLDNPTLALAIVGLGPQKAHLEELAKRLGVSQRIEFLGLRNDVHKVLQSSDIFVHPATWQEAFGLGIAEAMACGLPVIASNSGGIPEIIEDRVSGILTKPGDAGNLAQALQELIEDPNLRQLLGSRAQARMVEQFGLQRCVNQHIDWCERAIKI